MPSLLRSIPFGRFGGGMVTARPPSELADDEVVDALNKVFDKEDNLITRRGTALFSSTAPPNNSQRVTSLYELRTKTGGSHIIKTHGNDIREVTVSTDTSIKGGLTLPSDTYWQWVTFNNFAIGVNRGTGGDDNPVKWTGTGNATALTGSPPKGKFIETWNNRVFIVDADNPNVVKWCKLGDAEDWTDATAGSIEVGFDDGDIITGIVAHRKRLFIFKRFRIYYISTGTPNTDPSQWRLELYAKNVGCVSAYTIEAVLDDVLFLSDAGVVSLAAAESFGDFEQGLFSADLDELRDASKTNDTSYAVVDSTNSQYWVSIPNSTSGINNGTTFVLDYKRLAKGKIRWTRFEGRVVGSCYAVALVAGQKRVLIGTAENDTLRYGDENLYSDQSSLNSGAQLAYSKRILTQAYALQDPLVRKLFQHWLLAIELITCPITLTVKYRFDEREFLEKTLSLTFPCTRTGGGGGFGDAPNPNPARWDISLWDAALDAPDGGGFGGNVSEDSSLLREVRRRFSGNPGKRGQTVQFEFLNGQLGEAFLLKDFKLRAKVLSTDRVDDTD